MIGQKIGYTDKATKPIKVPTLDAIIASYTADGLATTEYGMELREAAEYLGKPVGHYLMIDDHFTWWECGRSYLCRIIDMLHMGLVTEVLFGSEVVERIPILVGEWIETAQTNGISLKRQTH